MTTADWTWDDDYRVAYAPTDDPRILAVIQRDDHASPPDGDVYAPAFQLDYHNYMGWSVHPYTSVYHDDESESIAQRIMAARDRFQYARLPFDTVERYARIFLGTTFETVSSHVHRDLIVIILNTPTWREHVGLGDEWIDTQLDGDTSTWQSYLDDDVYGIGYALNETHTDADAPIDLSEWDVTLDCWGFYGEEYAQSEAEGLPYSELPDLTPLLF